MPADDPQTDSEAAPELGVAEGAGSRGYGLWPKQWRWRISLILLLLIAFAAGAAWLGREQIAGDFIDDALAAQGIEARYEIVSIGTSRQVIANVEVGDEDAPDFTAEQIALDIAYTLGAPELGGIELVRPRLYGTFIEGELSLGALDPLLAGDGTETTGLPGIDLTVIDGRALIESDFGAIGAKFGGSGRLDDGFAGTLAATAPGIGTQDCRAEVATLYGDITSANDELSLDGPLRVRELTCQGADLAYANIATKMTLSDDLGSLEGNLDLYAEELAYGDNRAAALQGPAQLLWRFGGEDGQIVDLSHELGVAGVESAYGSIGGLRAEGRLRMIDDFARSEWRSNVTGSQMRLAPTITAPLSDLQTTSEGTYIASLLAKFEEGLSGALTGGEVGADITVRSDEDGLRVIIPQARLRSGSGETVLAVSRFNFASTGQLSGNVLAGGEDLPRINGRMEQGEGGALALRMSMAEYATEQGSLAIPRMEIRQSAGGRISFDGQVLTGGDLAGGALRGLVLPVEGSWSARQGLFVGRSCTEIRFAALRYAEISLANRSITLCPGEGGPMVRYRDALEIAVATDALDLAGAIGDSPAQITAERAEIRYPGPLAMTGLNAVIGEADSAVRFSAAQVDGQLGETIEGTFAGGDASLDLVPLDLSELSGAWSFADGALAIADGAFLLSDRPEPGPLAEARFQPLLGQGAGFVLADNAILADADLVHPGTGNLVTEVSIRHDLGTGEGGADLGVPGVTFAGPFQPDDLSLLTRGVIAAANGTIRGQGEVTWTGEDVASSGTFSTDNLDFAAAFGPVRGVHGEIVFTDLLALTTAPGQVIEIDSVNPGIEALGGRIAYSMVDGQLITVEDARWPFMGGELILRPVTLDYGGGDGQSYIFEVVGLDAASFVAQMELTNLGADGTFDGTIPIFFDASGNGSIRGGLLIARPPGGNVAYVGELTYEDLGQMANYAFQSLRSLDYRQMSVELNGDLAGEIITNFRIDGVSQGEGADQNFVTRRLAKLPIRFNVNVRSDNFNNLALVVRGMFDPTVFDNDAVRRSLGLEVTPLDPSVSLEPSPDPAPSDDPEPGEAQRRDEPSDESTVQPPESDSLP